MKHLNKGQWAALTGAVKGDKLAVVTGDQRVVTGEVIETEPAGVGWMDTKTAVRFTPETAYEPTADGVAPAPDKIPDGDHPEEIDQVLPEWMDKTGVTIGMVDGVVVILDWAAVLDTFGFHQFVPWTEVEVRDVSVGERLDVEELVADGGVDQ